MTYRLFSFRDKRYRANVNKCFLDNKPNPGEKERKSAEEEKKKMCFHCELSSPPLIPTRKQNHRPGQVYLILKSVHYL